MFKRFLAAAIFLGGVSLATAGVSTAPIAGCQQSDPSTACSSVPGAEAAAVPDWQKELEKAQKTNAACQAEIDKFCEGVQVGEGRIEACLKANKKKLSKKCRSAQGL